MTWFEGPYRTAVRRVQRYWRARQMRKRAAYLLERIEQQKDAFEARKVRSRRPVVSRVVYFSMLRPFDAPRRRTRRPGSTWTIWMLLRR